MSRKGKRLKAQKRKLEKRRRKEQRKALYASYAKHGKDKGSKRAKKNVKGAIASLTKKHNRCGNIGCLQCNPIVENLTRRRRWLVESGQMTMFDAYRESMLSKGIIQ